MLEHEGTSYKKWNSDEIIISSGFKDEEVTKLEEIKYLATILKEKFPPRKNSRNDLDFHVVTQEGVLCFFIEFRATKSAHTPEEIEEIVEEFENDIEENYIPIYNGVRTSMG